jgi:hypothetical protein
MNERQKLIGQVEWNSGGYGHGLCVMAHAMLWATDMPGPNKPDLRSIVAVSGPTGKYSTEELCQIAAFAKDVTARYDEMFTVRRGCNLILLDKRDDGRWLRKRLSWTQGPMYSDTLDDAIKVMGRRVGE